MSDFTKIIRLGTVEAWRGRRVSVFCKITLQDGRLSITGVEGPTPNGGAVSCGQIDMHLRDKPASEWNLAPGWNADLLARFFATWKRWHLNDMKAGSAAQEAWLRENPVNAIYPESHYERLAKHWPPQVSTRTPTATDTVRRGSARTSPTTSPRGFSHSPPRTDNRPGYDPLRPDRRNGCGRLRGHRAARRQGARPCRRLDPGYCGTPLTGWKRDASRVLSTI